MYRRLAYIIFIGIVLVPFVSRLRLELSGPLNFDSTVYLAIGRGILNGLLPYRDLVDIKPPGIFLVSALASLGPPYHPLTGPITVLSLLACPALLTIYALNERRSRAWWPVIVAGALGCLLAMYAQHFAGSYQVETLGMAAIAVYACTLVWPDLPEQWRRALAGIALLVASGLKEPFFFTALGTSAFLAVTFPERHVLRTTMWATAWAMVIGTLTLWLWGVWPYYLHTYLPLALARVHGPGAIVERAQSTTPLLEIGQYNPFFLGTITVGALVLSALVLRPATRGRTLKTTVLWSLAAILAATAGVAAGGWYGHHRIAAGSIVFALFLSLVRYWQAMEASSRRLIAVLCLLSVLTLPAQSPPAEQRIQRRERQMRVVEAQAIDSILDRCGQDRYLFLGENAIQVYAFTRHSPQGPLFFQYDWFFRGVLPQLEHAFVRSVEQANIVVQDRYTGMLSPQRKEVDRYLKQAFTNTPWECAGNFGAVRRYQLLFRRNGPLAQASNMR